MTHPIMNEVGGIFIPVSDIEQAKRWYSGLLGLEERDEILFGHIYVIPMAGPNIVLDSKIYTKECVLKTPAFHLNTEDIETAYDYVRSYGAELVTDIEHDHWFNFKDPDGNLLMVCRC